MISSRVIGSDLLNETHLYMSVILFAIYERMLFLTSIDRSHIILLAHRGKPSRILRMMERQYRRVRTPTGTCPLCS